MTFKPKIWYPIAATLSVLNIAAVYFAAGEAWHATGHAVLAVAFGVWATRLRGRLASGTGEVASMLEEVDDQAAALQDAQATLASQSRQLAELQERVDFAERVLIQNRNRSAAQGPQGQEK